MSLTTALLVLAIEILIATISVVTTRKRHMRARRLSYLFGIYSALTAFWAIGLAGTDEALDRASSGGTWIAVLLAAINCITFVVLHDARERMQYGSYPASE